MVSGIVILGIGILAVSFLINRSFEEMFPKEVSAGIVAHRGGGIEGPKNTVAGLNTAWEAGAYGSEIDIQRTKDGHYVVNHDGTFQRTAGDGRTPEEMTLEEVRTLSVDGEPVATFEEMLEAAHGKLILFTELKGDTAALNCDYLGLEEESATADAISAIHAQGKKALVWTTNEEKSQKHFLCSEVDGVITDNVRQAAGIVEELEKRTDLERIIDWLFT